MIIGLQTERMSFVSPNDPDKTVNIFVVRKALSPYQIEKARRQVGYEAISQIVDAAGADGLQDILSALNQGKTPEEIKAELDAAPKALPPGDDTGVEIGTGSPPEDEPEVPVQAQPLEALRASRKARFDMDWAAAQWIKAWSYRDEKGRKIPVKVKYIRMLDRPTRDFVHDGTWEAMRHDLGDEELAGNS